MNETTLSIDDTQQTLQIILTCRTAFEEAVAQSPQP
jgi:hypothetical protein